MSPHPQPMVVRSGNRPRRSILLLLALLCRKGGTSGFLLPAASPGGPGPAAGWGVPASASASPSSISASTSAESESAAAGEGENSREFSNPSIAAPSPREFAWWDEDCDRCLDELDGAGGERFVAFHDEDEDEDGTGGEEVPTHNWLHVTSSTPDRRAQYEVRYVAEEMCLAGVVRFGTDCEGPPGHVHGGAMATVADATTATAAFKAAGRWGLTTRLDCNYREMLPVKTPVRLEARVTELKKRKATVEWSICSLTGTDRNGEPVRHSFGTAQFLLPREEKK